MLIVTVNSNYNITKENVSELLWALQCIITHILGIFVCHCLHLHKHLRGKQYKVKKGF